MSPHDLFRFVQAGGDITTFLLDLHERNTGKLPAIADTPTVSMATTSRSLPAIPKRFYIDEDGRRCFKVTDLVSSANQLVEETVDRFYQALGDYPHEIILCPSRAILNPHIQYSPNEWTLIPFSKSFVFPIDYDVLLRR
ncbi:MAG TPA: hypothetical protein VF974_00855 [Patescibacteria group bacterium]